MKKFIYLMAMVCTLGFFTACSSDDDDNDFKRNEKIEGTWKVQDAGYRPWPCHIKKSRAYDGR